MRAWARDRYHRADTGAVGDGADPAAPADEDPGVGDAGAAQPDTTAPRRAEEEQSASVGAAIAAVATGDDAAAGRRRGLEVYGDSAYGTGAARAAYAEGGPDTVIKAKPLLPAVPGGFTLDLSGLCDYPDVDAVGREAWCSAGVSGTACTVGSG